MNFNGKYCKNFLIRNNFFIVSSTITLINLLLMFFGKYPFSVQTEDLELKALAAISYLRVVEGNGRINKSNYPEIIPPQNISSRVDGGAYDPQTHSIMLNIKGRRVVLNLKVPLVDNTVTPFTAKYEGKFSDDAPLLITAFPSIMSELIIEYGVKTKGTLEKKQNQINGRFISSGLFRWWSENPPRRGLPSEGNGSVSGQFTLKVQLGQQSDLRPPRLQPVRALW